MTHAVINPDRTIKELTPLFKHAREAHDNFKQAWNKNYPKMGKEYQSTPTYHDLLQKMNQAENRLENTILPIIDALKAGSKTNLEFA